MNRSRVHPFSNNHLLPRNWNPSVRGRGGKVVRIVFFNSGIILGWCSSAGTDDGELAGCELDTALFINEVENGARDLNGDLFGCFRHDEGRIWSVDGCEVRIGSEHRGYSEPLRLGFFFVTIRLGFCVAIEI
ncbi:hypothetical protein QL285_073734 [Trifolium repens]|nr:hypothetical protein QL285_073734 [Trifolium repens]